jgi:hypothetical protein
MMIAVIMAPSSCRKKKPAQFYAGRVSRCTGDQAADRGHAMWVTCVLWPPAARRSKSTTTKSGKRQVDMGAGSDRAQGPRGSGRALLVAGVAGGRTSLHGRPFRRRGAGLGVDRQRLHSGGFPASAACPPSLSSPRLQPSGSALGTGIPGLPDPPRSIPTGSPTNQAPGDFAAMSRPSCRRTSGERVTPRPAAVAGSRARPATRHSP